MNTGVVERYIAFVEKTIGQFREMGSLLREDEVDTPSLNKALASYYDVSLSLNSEYQRQKIEHSQLELDYQQWYDEKFTEAKRAVLNEYANSKSIKPSVKEFEVQLRSENQAAWREWQDRLTELDARVQFLLRLRELLNKYDNILSTLSYNIRSEMKSLSIEGRATRSHV